MGTSLVGWGTLKLYQTDEAEAPIIIPTYQKLNFMKTKNQNIKSKQRKKKLHLERAAADLVSKPTIKVSIGTKMPPPPTPPTVPHAEPRNPITVANTNRQLNSSFCNPINKSTKTYFYTQKTRKKRHSQARLSSYCQHTSWKTKEQFVDYWSQRRTEPREWRERKLRAEKARILL